MECISKSCQPRKSGDKTLRYKNYQFPVIVDISIQNLLKLDWNSLCNSLSRSNEVCSLYQFFSAIYTWLFMPKGVKGMNVPRIDFSDSNYISDMIDIMQDRCWGKISDKHLKSITLDRLGTNKLIKSILNSEELLGKNGILFKSERDYSISELFNQVNLAICVISEDEDTAPSQTKENRPCIMLRSTLENSTGQFEHFVLEIVQSAAEDTCTEHKHNLSVLSQSFSLLINVTSELGTLITPVPFNCLPRRDSNGCWYWGFHRFLNGPQDTTAACNLPCHYAFTHAADAKITFLLEVA